MTRNDFVLPTQPTRNFIRNQFYADSMEVIQDRGLVFRGAGITHEAANSTMSLSCELDRQASYKLPASGANVCCAPLVEHRSVKVGALHHIPLALSIGTRSALFVLLPGATSKPARAQSDSYTRLAASGSSLPPLLAHIPSFTHLNPVSGLSYLPNAPDCCLSPSTNLLTRSCAGRQVTRSSPTPRRH